MAHLNPHNSYRTIEALFGGPFLVAWFQTTQTATAVVGNHSGINNITVNGPAEEAASYNFTIAASVATADEGTLILTTVEGDAGSRVLNCYTLDAGLQKVAYTPTSGQLKYVHYTATITGTFSGSNSDEAEAAMLNANNKTYTLTIAIGGTSAARGRIGKTSKATSPAGDAEGTAVTGTSDLTWTLNVSDFDGYTHVADSHVYSTTVDFYFRAEGENVSNNANVADSELTFAINASGAVSQ